MRRAGSSVACKPLSQFAHHTLHVGRQGALKRQLVAAFRVHEAEFGRMKHHPRRPRLVPPGSPPRCRVDPLPADRMPQFGQMDADLMGAAGLETTLHQRVGIAEMLDRVDVRDGQLAAAVLARSPPAVTAITNEMRSDRAGRQPPHHQRQIASLRGVQPKLLGQNPPGRHRPGEDQEAAGLTVDAMHRPHRLRPPPPLAAAPLAAAGEFPGDRLGHEFLERRLKLPAAGGPAPLLVVTGACHSRWLVDHHDRLVEMDDSDIARRGRPRRGILEHLDNLARLKPAAGVGADVAVNQDPPATNELLHLRPACGVDPAAQKCSQGLAAIGGDNVVDGAVEGLHVGLLDRFFPGFTLSVKVAGDETPPFQPRSGESPAVPGTCVIGLQWGDEAKGKLVDILTGEHDIVVRYAGGANAGHTVVSAGETWKLSLIPSGILRDGVQCVVTGGVVLDPASAIAELDMLESRGVTVAGKLRLSDRAHVVFPWHLAEDRHLDASLSGGGAIGTTGRGIGPCYRDKVGRALAIRLGDLYQADLRERIEHVAAFKNRLLASWQRPGDDTLTPLDPAEIHRQYLGYAERLRPFVSDTTAYLLDSVEDGRRLLFEGAQGALLDIDHGTFPYVTSSNSSGLGVAAGSGVPGRWIERVIGVVKAYSTRVGGGPLPTEQDNAVGKHLRERGNEYGTVTRRPRRCGWFDAVAARYTARLSGVDELAVMLLDVLGGLDEIKVCSAYEIDGRRVTQFPSQLADLERAVPIYETLPGWEDDLTGVRSDADLPAAARRYLDAIGEMLGRPVSIVSVGPDRAQTIFCDRSRRPPWQASHPSTAAGA